MLRACAKRTVRQAPGVFPVTAPSKCPALRDRWMKAYAGGAKSRSTAGATVATVVENQAAACPQSQLPGIRSDALSVAKLLRLPFPAQSRSFRRFDRRFGSHPGAKRALQARVLS